MRNKIYLILMLLVVPINFAFSQGETFDDLTNKHVAILRNTLSDGDRNILANINLRLKQDCDAFQQSCKASYSQGDTHLVLFFYPNTKKMELVIFNKIVYYASDFVTFTNLGVRYNNTITTIPLENTYKIVPGSYSSLEHKWIMNNRVFGPFTGSDIENIRKEFSSCSVLTTKKLIGYKHKLQCKDSLNTEVRIYPRLQQTFIGGYFVPDIGMHDLLFFSALLQRIGYKWSF